MILKLNESVNIMEGGMQEICVEVNDQEQLRERDIPISLSVTFSNITSGKYTWFMSVSIKFLRSILITSHVYFYIKLRTI